MPDGNELVEAAEAAMRQKYGSAALHGKNNRFYLDLANGERAVVKTGSNGQVMQRTHGKEVDARYTGLDDADRVVIASRCGKGAPIRVYDLPKDVYVNRMTYTYAQQVKSDRLNPSDLRVLRFDATGYPEQRVAEEWAKYLVESRDPNPTSSSLPAIGSPPLGQSDAIEVAKAIVAEAFGVQVGNVSISVTM